MSGKKKWIAAGIVGVCVLAVVIGYQGYRRAVDTPPQLDGIRDIYVALGMETDFLQGVTAQDEEDGELTEKIAVDASGADLEAEGTYGITYSVKDSCGIRTTAQAEVTVESADRLQQQIAAHAINRQEQYIIGAPNLYDAGIAENQSLEETLEDMRPAVVQLYHETEDGKYTAGSGFLIEISDENAYICTNRHVIEAYQEWDVFFYDGTKLQGKPVGTSEIYDVGIVKVAVESIPDVLLAELKTVHIDLTEWTQMSETESEVGLLRVDQNGGVLHTLSGSIVKKETEFLWGKGEKETEMKLAQSAGDSGSAVFDRSGNLISMVFGTSNDISGDRDWGVPLPAIIDCYEQITGRELYVYESKTT